MGKRTAAKFLTVFIVIVLILSQATGAVALNAKDAKLRNDEIKNIIVMIPDGMSCDGVALSRWYRAYDAKTGKVDTSVMLAMDELASGMVRTFWQDAEGGVGAITDSAPAATAYACGIKTFDKFIGVTPDSVPVATILEGANLIGKATGLVATSNIQHATPAGYSAHINDRSRYDVIGEQQAYNGLDVVLSCGSMYLASRADNENILGEIKKMGYNYVTTREEMSQVSEGAIWGMFARDAMAYEMDRQQGITSLRNDDTSEQPSLAEMTDKAIELLSQNENGFFLMVEGSKIDWAAHANDPIGLISDILAFDDAVKVALDYAKANQDTMLLIMSDHGNGGITIGDSSTDSSYSRDLVPKFLAPLMSATLTGEGIASVIDEDATNIAEVMKTYYGIDDLTAEEIAEIKERFENDKGGMNYTVGPMISKRAHLGWTTTGHTGEEVTLYTYLPGDGRITGTLDNTDIALICAGVWGIDLEQVTKQIFVEAIPAFKAKGAEIDVFTEVPSNGILTVTKGSVTLTIMENKNFVLLNGSKLIINSVIVNQSGNFYVPQSVINMIP